MTALAEIPAPPGDRVEAPARPRGRGERDLAGRALLAALFAACAYAAFAHGAVDLADEAPLQAALALLALGVAAAALGAGRLVPRASGAGWLAVGLLAGFAGWCGLSLAWSVTPDLSWQATNRAAAYALVVVLALAAGARAPRAVDRAALGLLAVSLAVALDALAGKALPGLTDGTALSPRLREPLGYWNALALVCVLGMPVALAVAADAARGGRLRLAALGALWLLVVVTGLTYSRGAIVAFAVALAVVVALGDARLRALGVAALAGAAAAPALAFAFTRSSLATPDTPLAQRAAGGRELLGVLAVCLVALLAAGWLALRAERRVAWSAARTRRAWAGLGVIAALLVAGLAVSGGIADAARQFADTRDAPSVSTPSRLLSTNSGNRVQWWGEALGAWSDRPLAGHGAGSFPALHLQYRHNRLPVRQPHDAPLQFLAETGLVGAALALGGIAALLWAAGTAVRARPRGSPERRLAVALLAGGAAWTVHALVDWDWDIPGVTVPALLALGVVAARPAGARKAPGRPRRLALVVAALAGWAYLASVALPALADRKAEAALRAARPDATPAALQSAAARAELGARLDPLSVRSLFAGAAIAQRRGRALDARRLLLDAVHREPSNAQAWLRLASDALSLVDRPGAEAAARRALELDPRNPEALRAAQAAVALVAPPEDSPSATGTPLVAQAGG
ncbi:MAG TPA: O-antigen ligase family protein [Solirubrobacteraceae bacterium]